MGALWSLALDYNYENSANSTPGRNYEPYFWQTMDITEAIQNIVDQLTRIADSSEATNPTAVSFFEMMNLQFPQHTTMQYQQAIALGADVVVPGSTAAAETPTPLWMSSRNASLGVYSPQSVDQVEVTIDPGDSHRIVAGENYSGTVYFSNGSLEPVFLTVDTPQNGTVFNGFLDALAGSSSLIDLAPGEAVRFTPQSTSEPWLFTITFIPELPAEPLALVNRDPVAVSTSQVTVNENTYELCCTDQPPSTLQTTPGCRQMEITFLTGSEIATGVRLLNGDQVRYQIVAETAGEHLIVVTADLIDSDADLLTCHLYVSGELVDTQTRGNSGSLSFSPTVSAGQEIQVIIVSLVDPAGSWDVYTLEACVNPIAGQYEIFNTNQAVIATIGTGVKQAFATTAGNVQITGSGVANMEQPLDLQLDRFQVRFTNVISPTLPIAANAEIILVDSLGAETTLVGSEAISGVDKYTDRVYTASAATWRTIKVNVTNATTEIVELAVQVWGFFDS